MSKIREANQQKRLDAANAEIKRLREWIGMADNRLECAAHPDGCWRCADVARSYLQEALTPTKTD
jgi:hypothetical protein